MQILI